MALLYDRIESDKHTIIRYSRFLAGFGAVVGIVLVLLFVLKSPSLSLIAYVLLFVVITLDMRPARRELIAASRAGLVTRSGSRLSIREPLTYYIEKPATPRRGKKSKRSN